MVFLIDGVDFSDCIKEGGLKVQRNDIDGEDAGRTTMDGVMHRARVAIKYRLDVTCMPLTAERTQELFEAIEPEFVDVTFTHPRYGLGVWTMYSNNVPATHLMTGTDGVEYWSGITFPLIER